ncbi:Ran guanine nucleotide release factor [Echinococcus granulosus]|uniref:Ran guanine nucleotide release factor n=1 Tax=Echinococcus granulosus TaxID=6210 RepID=W6UP78_ECHGR|nr:Ran guanine nucleotide release factor [Echinococcus granulosus]EUB63450.1 Ran guanine nucleotide release factor [Echinococcus granulosus]
MATLNGLTRRSLFGGAFQIFLPSPAQDVSAFRQVPDNQEVFVNPSNNQSITVDILEAVSSSSLPEAVNLHFQEIVNCNSASDSVVDSVEIQHIPNGPPAVLLRGKQKVAKFNRLQSDLVDIAVMLYRFPDYSADVLVCFNDPIMSVCACSSDARLVAMLRTYALTKPLSRPPCCGNNHLTLPHLLVTVSHRCQDQSEVSPSGRWSDEDVNLCLHSLKLLDPAIFASEA